jgi:urease accessory protein
VKKTLFADKPYREGGPTIFAQVKHGKGVDHIVDLMLSAWRSSGASEANPQ